MVSRTHGSAIIFLSILCITSAAGNHKSRCPSDEYYNSKLEKCKTCSTCEEDQAKLKPCTATSDTRCGASGSAIPAFEFSNFFNVVDESTNEDVNDAAIGSDAGNEKDDAVVIESDAGNKAEDDDDNESSDDPLYVVVSSEEAFWRQLSFCLIGVLIFVVLLFVLYVAYTQKCFLKSWGSTMCKDPNTLYRRARLFSRDRLTTNEYIQAMQCTRQSWVPQNLQEAEDQVVGLPDNEIRIAPDGTQFIDEVFTQENGGQRVMTTIRLPIVDEEEDSAGQSTRKGATPMWWKLNHQTNKCLKLIMLNNQKKNNSAEEPGPSHV